MAWAFDLKQHQQQLSEVLNFLSICVLQRQDLTSYAAYGSTTIIVVRIGCFTAFRPLMPRPGGCDGTIGAIGTATLRCCRCTGVQGFRLPDLFYFQLKTFRFLFAMQRRTMQLETKIS